MSTKRLPKGDREGKVEGSRGKQAQAVALDLAMDERVRAIITDPGVRQSVKDGLDRLISKLAGELSDPSVMPDLPETDIAEYMAVSNAYLCEKEDGKLTDGAREAAARLVAYVERHEPEEYKVARRCAEVWEAQRAKDKAEGSDGACFFMEAVDRVTEGGKDGLMLASPREELFTLVFTRAVRDIGRDDEDYVALKKLIAEVEAGASLAAMYEEEKRRDAERSARQSVEELSKPEPQDKTTDEWRYWKLRHLEADFASDDTGRAARAWREFFEFFDGLKRDRAQQTAHTARQLLPSLIIAAQESERTARGERKGRRAKR
jgi:hypothetical protein